MNKRVGVVVLFALLLLSFVPVFVSAAVADIPLKEALQTGIFDPVKDMFSSWTQGQLSVNIAKYVFWFLLTLVIYSTLALMPFFSGQNSGQTTIRFVISLLVAFLATAYLTPQDIYTALVSYGALGIVLGAALPFLILLFFSIEIRRTAGPGGAVFSKLLWIAFILFLVWKLIQGMFFLGLNGVKAIGYVEGFIYIGFIVLSLLWIWFLERKFLKFVFKEELTAVMGDRMNDIAASLVAEISRREDRSSQLSGSAKQSYDRKTEELRKELKRVESGLGR